MLERPQGWVQGGAGRAPGSGDDRGGGGREVATLKRDRSRDTLCFLPACRRRRSAGDRMSLLFCRETAVDWKLELVVVPVSDVDRAKAFYLDRAGFGLDVDHRAGPDFRVVQLSPRGSACAISLMRNADAAGSLRGLHLVVHDIDAARTELLDSGPSRRRSSTSRMAPSNPAQTRAMATTAPSSRSATRTATAGWSRRSRAGPRRRRAEGLLGLSARVPAEPGRHRVPR